jgi:hypothetical protein
LEYETEKNEEKEHFARFAGICGGTDTAEADLEQDGHRRAISSSYRPFPKIHR